LEMSLFPTPAHGQVHIRTPFIWGDCPLTLAILDALGRPVRTQTAAGAKTDLDLTGLAPGLYAVRVAAGGATATQRLVVE
jgi:hypothetical protein